MKKSLEERLKNKRVISTIPYGKTIEEADFLVFDDGTIGVLSKTKKVTRIVKNLNAACRMFLYHIPSQYRKMIFKIKSIQITHLGQMEQMDIIKEEMFMLINQIQKANVKQLKDILNKLSDLKNEMDKQISEITKKQIDIARWSLKKGKIILEEKERIQNILDTTFTQLLRFYVEVSKTQKLNKIALNAYFGKTNLNLLNGLRTINVLFRDIADDLERIKDIIHKCERLILIENAGEFLKRLFVILKEYLPLLETPIEIIFEAPENSFPSLNKKNRILKITVKEGKITKEIFQKEVK